MTNKQLHTKNNKLISLYMASMELEALTYNQRLKLATEIGRLQHMNQTIEAMTVETYYKPANAYTYKTHSFLNVTYT